VQYEKECLINSNDFAMILASRPEFRTGKIRLLSCSTGKIDKYGNCFAQELANKLGVDVFAPIDVLNIKPTHELTVGGLGEEMMGEDGFRWFYAKKKVDLFL